MSVPADAPNVDADTVESDASQNEERYEPGRNPFQGRPLQFRLIRHGNVEAAPRDE